MPYSFELELDSVKVECWICLEYRECHPAPVLEDGDLEEGCEDYRFPRSGTIDSGKVTFCKDIDGCMIIFWAYRQCTMRLQASSDN
jgi:hypothetical protein